MRRKIEQTLADWKANSNGKTAILIEGARRVGKSYIVKQFAEQNYKSYILIDFNKASDDVKNLFLNNLEDLDTFFLYLSSYYGIKLYERESLIIFDEVQLFPRARSAIKYLVEDGRYDYIETGSLVSIKSNTADILIPSEERHTTLYPMDFEEFLWAMGNADLYEHIRDCFNKRQPMGPLLHRKAMEALRSYEIIGGMPQAVEAFVADKSNFAAADAIKRDILALYRDDIKKHAGVHAEKAKSIFDNIPAQLMRHDKKFHLAELDKDARMRSYADAFLWLDDAKIVNISYNTTEPSVGLTMSQEHSTMKLYMADTGLLISQAFDNESLVGETIYQKILTDKLSFNQGMVIENLVSQMLRASGHRLYFYSRSDRDDKDDRMEIDFVIQKRRATSRHNISPIEVKSSNQYTLTSLNKYRKKYANELYTAYVIHTDDLRAEGDIVYLPLYMAGLL